MIDLSLQKVLSARACWWYPDSFFHCRRRTFRPVRRRSFSSCRPGRETVTWSGALSSRAINNRADRRKSSVCRRGELKTSRSTWVRWHSAQLLTRYIIFYLGGTLEFMLRRWPGRLPRSGKLAYFLSDSCTNACRRLPNPIVSRMARAQLSTNQLRSMLLYNRCGSPR